MTDLGSAIVDLDAANSFIPPLPKTLCTLMQRIERRAPIAAVNPEPFKARVTQLACLWAWRYHASVFITRASKELRIPAEPLALAVSDLLAARNGWTPAPAEPLIVQPPHSFGLPSASGAARHLSTRAPCVVRTSKDWRPPAVEFTMPPNEWVDLADYLVDPPDKRSAYYRWIRSMSGLVYEFIGNKYWKDIVTWAVVEHDNETPKVPNDSFTSDLDAYRRRHPFVYKQVPDTLLPYEPVARLSPALTPSAAMWWGATGGLHTTFRFRDRANGWVGLASFKLGVNPFADDLTRAVHLHFGANWPLLLFWFGGPDEGRIIRNLARAIVDRVDSLGAQLAIGEWTLTDPHIDMTEAARIVLGLPYLIGCDLAPVSYRDWFPDPTFLGRKGGIVYRFTYDEPIVQNYWSWFISLILSDDSVWYRSIPECYWFDYGEWWRTWAAIRVQGSNRAADILDACNRRRFARMCKETIDATEPPNPVAIQDLVRRIRMTAMRYRPNLRSAPNPDLDLRHTPALPKLDPEWYWNARRWDSQVFIDETWQTAKKPPGRPKNFA